MIDSAAMDTSEPRVWKNGPRAWEIAFDRIGNGYHDAGLGEEHRTDGVDAVDELAAQTAFRAQDGSQRAKYRTQHDQVNHIVSELGHLRRSPLGRLP